MWAVTSKGLLSGDGPFPVDAVQIDEETYTWLNDNLDVLNIEIRDGQVHASVDLVAYKRVALSRVVLHDWTVHGSIKVYDHELPLVMQLAKRNEGIYLREGLFLGTSESLATAINKRNRIYHTVKSTIQNAETPIDVDAAMELYSQWQTN